MIILFDIDYTLINTDVLRDNIQNKRLPDSFGISAQKLEEYSDQYVSTLNSIIEFCPREYIRFVTEKLDFNLDPNKEEEAIEVFFNNEEDFTASLYSETVVVLESLVGKHHLGIFSHGDFEFQRAKIDKSGIKGYFDPELVFIFPEKTTRLDFVWDKVKEYQDSVIIVDDDLENIEAIARTEMVPIYLDRIEKAVTSHITINNLRGLEAQLSSLS